MGRPIKKQYIGNTAPLPDPAANGNQIQCLAFFPGGVASTPSWIQEQVGTGRYYAVSEDGTQQGIVTLANADGASLIQGQACVWVDPINPALPTRFAQVIYDNTVRTWDGIHFKWYFDATHAPAGEVLAAVIQHA